MRDVKHEETTSLMNIENSANKENQTASWRQVVQNSVRTDQKEPCGTAIAFARYSSVRGQREMRALCQWIKEISSNGRDVLPEHMLPPGTHPPGCGSEWAPSPTCPSMLQDPQNSSRVHHNV